MEKKYTIKDIERLFNKTRTGALRFAQTKGWEVRG